MESAHSLTAEEVLRRFGVRESCGLSAEQVRRHREKYGANGKEAPTTLLRRPSSPPWGGWWGQGGREGAGGSLRTVPGMWGGTSRARIVVVLNRCRLGRLPRVVHGAPRAEAEKGNESLPNKKNERLAEPCGTVQGQAASLFPRWPAGRQQKSHGHARSGGGAEAAGSGCSLAFGENSTLTPVSDRSRVASPSPVTL